MDWRTSISDEDGVPKIGAHVLQSAANRDVGSISVVGVNRVTVEIDVREDVFSIKLFLMKLTFEDKLDG